MGLSFAPTERLSTFIEYFGTVSEQSPEHNLDAGILYLVNPSFQVDIAAGHSIFAPDDRFFSTFGISYLFDRKKDKSKTSNHL